MTEFKFDYRNPGKNKVTKFDGMNGTIVERPMVFPNKFNLGGKDIYDAYVAYLGNVGPGWQLVVEKNSTIAYTDYSSAGAVTSALTKIIREKYNPDFTVSLG